ncbi:MAG: HINT domain-containing protein, partial [Clostridia bacterium]|nr:HINT domain-containing protein [Clostridia bacterium]
MLSNGSCGIIEEIQVEELSKPEITYNFEVADFHTYYVAASKVLCHNKCSGKKYNSQQEAYDAAKSDLGINANEMPLERRISYYDDGTGYWLEQIMDVYSDNRVIVNHGRGHVYSG